MRIIAVVEAKVVLPSRMPSQPFIFVCVFKNNKSNMCSLQKIQIQNRNI